MSNHKTPSIRFKGFTDDWEQRKLGNVIEIAYQGINTTADKVEYVSEGVPILQGKHITSGKIDYKDVRYLDKEKYESVYYPKYVPKVNDILLANIGTIGPLVVMKPGVELLIAWNIMLIRLNKMGDVKFVKVFLDKLNNSNFYESIMRGNATKFINKDGIMSIEIPYPTICEQEKIGAWFEQLDNLITLHQRKYEKLVNVKKSMLDKMFPKNGEKVPEIRFKGFTDDWEQRKLGELISEYKETVDSSCTLPVLTSSKTEGVILQEEHFGRKQQHDITGYNVLPRSYCTYRNRSDGVDFTFNVNECCDMGIISKFYPVFCGNDNDTYFLSLVLNNSDEVVHEIAYTCTGTGQKVLSFLDLQKMSIRVPRHDEQKKISAYFKQLDNLITLHQRELEKLQNLKKSLLNSMFI